MRSQRLTCRLRRFVVTAQCHASDPKLPSGERTKESSLIFRQDPFFRRAWVENELEHLVFGRRDESSQQTVGWKTVMLAERAVAAANCRARSAELKKGSACVPPRSKLKGSTESSSPIADTSILCAVIRSKPAGSVRLGVAGQPRRPTARIQMSLAANWVIKSRDSSESGGFGLVNS